MGFLENLFEEEGAGDGLDRASVAAMCAENHRMSLRLVILIRATSFLFTKYKYLGIFMVFCGVGIVLFLGSVEGFNKDSEGKFCKLTLSNAVFGQLWKPEKVLEWLLLQLLGLVL
ncbi:unnamed protein product [Musa acuminata var. zebrina]